MKKLTFEKVCEKFYAHNAGRPVTQFDDDKRLNAVVVFKQGSWFNREYTEDERSYRFSSDNKYFIQGMGGQSIYATCIGDKENIRLDWYLGEWEVDYCYIEGDEDNE